MLLFPLILYSEENYKYDQISQQFGLYHFEVYFLDLSILVKTQTG